MKLEQLLNKAGLTNAETRIYLYLLENGVASPPEISKGTKIALPNCYPVIKSLKTKNLVESQSKGRRLLYIPTDPLALVQNLERRKQKVEEALPDLRALYKSQKNKPSIKFLEGKDQILEGSFMQIFNSEEVLFMGSTAKTQKIWPTEFVEIEDKLKKNGVLLKDLMSYESASKTALETKKRMGEILYNAFVLPKRYKDIPTNILIWDDNIALISLDEPIFGTVLKNKNLADTLRILFDIGTKASTEI